jgi:hypothetical protein
VDLKGAPPCGFAERRGIKTPSGATPEEAAQALLILGDAFRL